jgi:hypothetical protein
VRFDENGKFIKQVRVTANYHDKVVVDLESTHQGISDKSLKIVLSMVRDGKSQEFRDLLDRLNNSFKPVPTNQTTPGLFH